MGEAGKEETQREEDDRALHDATGEPAPRLAMLQTWSEGERDGYPNREQEEGKDQVRRCPAVPVRVGEGWVNRAPRPGIVDDDHAGDGQPPEDVEGEEPTPSRLHARRQHTSGRAAHR